MEPEVLSEKILFFSEFFLSRLISFHYYGIEIFSFPENLGKNEGSEKLFFPRVSRIGIGFFPRVRGIGMDFFIPVPVGL